MWVDTYEYRIDPTLLWKYQYTKFLSVIGEMCPCKNVTVKKPEEEWVFDRHFRIFCTERSIIG